MASKQKKKRIKAVQQKMRLFRATNPFISVLMWGVNHTISELSMINNPVMLMPDDFKAFSRLRIDNHLFNKENMPSHFRFKEYCPMVFRDLRARFSVDDEIFMYSLSKECPQSMDSPGKSGCKFFVTFDLRFIIKVVSSDDISEMLRILKSYHQYIVENDARSLLPQILAMYKATVNDNDHHVIVTNNVFSGSLNIHKKYDLKGSTIDREASNKERCKTTPTLKDQDFLKSNERLHLSVPDKQKILSILSRDTKFLTDQHLMDYSLLIGIHDLDKIEDEEEEEEEEEEEREESSEEEENKNDCFEDEDDIQVTGMNLMNMKVKCVKKNNSPKSDQPSVSQPLSDQPPSNKHITNISKTNQSLEKNKNEKEEENNDSTETLPISEVAQSTVSKSSVSTRRAVSINEEKNMEQEEEEEGEEGEEEDGSQNQNKFKYNKKSKPANRRYSLQCYPKTWQTSAWGSSPSSPSPSSPSSKAFNPKTKRTLFKNNSTLEEHPPNAFKSNQAAPQRLLYYISIIDILTKYNMKKRTAQAAKTVKHGANPNISTVKPEQYAKRFLQFIEQSIVT